MHISLALCPDGIISYVGIVSCWDHTLCWLCYDVTYFLLALYPGVTYFIWALCPGGTISYLGIVSCWDHTLCWLCVLTGSYLMLALCGDMTYFLLALCPDVTDLLLTWCPDGTIPYVFRFVY